MSENGATAVVDQTTEAIADKATGRSVSEGVREPWHPDWCDRELCTWSEGGGAHHSAWVTLGPLAQGLVVRAYLFAMDDVTVDDVPERLVMISFHYPVVHPEDIALNAGIDEDTAPCLVLPAHQILELNGWLTMLGAVAHGLVGPRIEPTTSR